MQLGIQGIYGRRVTIGRRTTCKYGCIRYTFQCRAVDNFSSYEDFEYIDFDRRDNGVVIATFNRPDTLNSANVRLHREMSEIWHVVDADEQVRCVVVTGAGRAFSAGGDMGMIEEMTSSYEAMLVQWRDAGAIVEKLISSRKPVVSAINGVAVGAGLAIALMADISVMGESVRLTDGHVRIGVAAGDHGALVWPMLCGMAKAKYYLMTADFLDGREAERIGLVSKCVPDDQVLPEAIAIAERLAAGSQLAIEWTKKALNGWYRQSMPIFGESLALEMLCFLGEDVKEGVAAVKGKRPPNFSQRA